MALFLAGPSLCSIEDSNEPKCPAGYGLGFNGECIKKFVPPKRIECPEPELKFGQFELQLDGRFVNFWCEDGWTLVPDEFSSAVCKLGNWSKNFPQCVRPGCDEIKAPENGQFEYSFDGALVSFKCDQNLIIEGEPILGCDGQHWNASVPLCVQPKTSGSQKSFKMHLSIFILLFITAFQ